MMQQMMVINKTDKDGNPMGGEIKACGLEIRWQDGPLGRGEGRKAPNGCFVETVIAAVMSRLEFYQRSRFQCVENGKAITCLKEALSALEGRTRRREREGVEGTNKV